MNVEVFSPCPSDVDILAYVEADPDAPDLIASHVMGCPVCMRKVDNLLRKVLLDIRPTGVILQFRPRSK